MCHDISKERCEFDKYHNYKIFSKLENETMNYNQGLKCEKPTLKQ